MGDAADFYKNGLNCFKVNVNLMIDNTLIEDDRMSVTREIGGDVLLVTVTRMYVRLPGGQLRYSRQLLWRSSNSRFFYASS